MRTLLAMMALPLLFAQDEKRPQFEVASIKPSAPDERFIRVRGAPGGRVDINNVTLKFLIQYAWGVQPFQISGGATWSDSLHYDISAKAESDPKGDEMLLMLRALLEDRFQLKIHRETKEAPIYALVLARKDGKLGPGLTLAQDGGCVKIDPSKPPEPPPPGTPRPNYCGGQMMSPKSLKAVSVPVANILAILARTLGRTVVDQTGLKGNYDISLEWSPDEAQLAMLPPDLPRPPVDASGPSIFTAIQEQLGLKLESQKGPVEMLAIDRAEKPSEN
jgi:uncharacterized protein (TIGR03435 family)